MDELEVVAIEANLFPTIRPLVRERPDFAWHRDRFKRVTANQAISSQAFAIDFFGTISRLASRNAIVNRWMNELNLSGEGRWQIEFEVLIPKEVLREPRSTQVDVLAACETGVVLFECKFTEPDGGACSQPVPIAGGAHHGLRQCNGRYEEQINPVSGSVSRCALTGKGIRYWDLIPEVMNLDRDVNYHPCPVSGGWYQWMRNLVAALALGEHRHVRPAFVVVYVDGPFPMAKRVAAPEWNRLEDAVRGKKVPLRAVSYQQLLEVALGAAAPNDRVVMEELRFWLIKKIEKATVAREVQDLAT